MRCRFQPPYPACLRWRSWRSRESGELGIGEALQLRIDQGLRQAVGVVAEGGETDAENDFQRLLIVIACRAEGGQFLVRYLALLLNDRNGEAFERLQPGVIDRVDVAQ